MNTLVIWMSYQGVDLYLLHWHEASLYGDIDTCYDPDNRKVEHLGYMLGQNEYFGEIPEYSKFVSGDGWDVNCQKSKAVAPWASRLVSLRSNIVDFRKVVRVIRTGVLE